ncbi:MAG: hypothetical protein ABEL97_07490 [Salinibacter sp.]
MDPPAEDETDRHAWALREALALFRTANPAPRKWLHPPPVCREAVAVMDRGLARSVDGQNRDDEPIARGGPLRSPRPPGRAPGRSGSGTGARGRCSPRGGDGRRSGGPLNGLSRAVPTAGRTARSRRFQRPAVPPSDPLRAALV